MSDRDQPEVRNPAALDWPGYVPLHSPAARSMRSGRKLITTMLLQAFEAPAERFTRSTFPIRILSDEDDQQQQQQQQQHHHHHYHPKRRSENFAELLSLVFLGRRYYCSVTTTMWP